MLEKVHW